MSASISRAAERADPLTAVGEATESGEGERTLTRVSAIFGSRARSRELSERSESVELERELPEPLDCDCWPPAPAPPIPPNDSSRRAFARDTCAFLERALRTACCFSVFSGRLPSLRLLAVRESA